MNLAGLESAKGAPQHLNLPTKLLAADPQAAAVLQRSCQGLIHLPGTAVRQLVDPVPAMALSMYSVSKVQQVSHLAVAAAAGAAMQSV